MSSSAPRAPLEEALVAVEWRDGRARPLGTLGGRESAATAIGGDGTIVGWSQTTDGALHAFVRRPDSPMQDLGTLGGTTSIASAIDRTGHDRRRFFANR